MTRTCYGHVHCTLTQSERERACRSEEGIKVRSLVVYHQFCFSIGCRYTCHHPLFYVEEANNGDAIVYACMHPSHITLVQLQFIYLFFSNFFRLLSLALDLFKTLPIKSFSTENDTFHNSLFAKCKFCV